MWSRIKGAEGVKVSLSPAAFLKYEKLFTSNNIKYDIVQNNLQEYT